MIETPTETTTTAGTSPDPGRRRAASWAPWRVAPRSGFEVHDGKGDVGLIQIDPTQFLVTEEFRFSDPAVEQALVDELESGGLTEAQARAAVDDARTITPPQENPTDLASIPRFMRWFEGSYGLHTLAAIIHDELIRKEPNDGALGSDVLSDRFFRQMLAAAGVPFLKRWIIWAAVAMRSRWAAGGLRLASLCLWIVLAVTGIVSFVTAVGVWWLGWSSPVDALVLVVVAVVLPFASMPLWGRQGGASLVAAVAALWVIPAAAFALLGYVVYSLLEGIARRVGLA